MDNNKNASHLVHEMKKKPWRSSNGKRESSHNTKGR